MSVGLLWGLKSIIHIEIKNEIYQQITFLLNKMNELMETITIINSILVFKMIILNTKPF